MTRKEFSVTAGKVIALARIAASFTPTPKDDDVVELIAHLFEDPEHFEKVCNLLGIPPDAPGATKGR